MNMHRLLRHRFSPAKPVLSGQNFRTAAIVTLAIFALCLGCPKTSAADAADNSAPLDWATPTRENHPWTRWWWMGNAVDKTNLTHQLEMFKDAGIGGVEICPIYGAHGYEDRFIQYLSPEWMEMLAHTTSEASRLGLGVDLTTGTGWPFGGERVTPELASGSANMKRFDLAGGTSLTSPFPKGRLQTLRAIGEDGTQIDLSPKVTDGHLDWTAPPGTWQLYGIWEVSPVQKVKRPAPGGAGSVLDPFSTAAMDSYLADFDEHFKAYHGAMPRSEFHDSYEYYNASWTPSFFAEFAARRGYDLRTQLPALFGDGPEETSGRVRNDYRQTIADLHLAYIQHWTAWSHSHGSLSRDQAHGSPANLLDVYAAADIPETEMMPFGGMAADNYPLNKFSSSAARDKGTPLASSESFTWLTEHFNAPLSLVKQAADYLFLTGVNHIFFHGIPYSPVEAPWPGWQFYAAVNFGPYGGLWHDLPAFNSYVTRCQSVLQTGAPANDVLVYYNIFDVWDKVGQRTNGLIIQSPLPASLKDTALTLLDRGYGFDYVSDRFLAQTKFEAGRLMLGGNPARVILAPPCRLMPAASLEKLIDLARDGATIIFLNNLPGDVPGLADLEQQHAKFKTLIAEINLAKTTDPRIQSAKLGAGTILLGPDVDALLTQAGVKREPMADNGLWFVRRTSATGLNYFLANRGDKPVDQWITLGVPAQSAVLLDPRFAHRGGVAALRQTTEGATQIYLQLLPGESRILRTFAATTVTGPAWSDFAVSGPSQDITGTWEVNFVEGGPVLPAAYTTTNLASWTSQDDPEAKRFAGTARYTIGFDHPAGEADDWILDLGRVCETAVVKIDGHVVGALWSAPYQIAVGQYLQPGRNILEVDVTNLAANRVRDLDIRKVKWKYFYDANLASRHGGRGGLDASDWPLRDSGLLGAVTLRPVKKIASP
jgi:hypothetical protein